MTGSSRKPGRPLRRLGRLLFGKNELRRPADRVEAALIMSLAAAFLIAAIAAICFAGHLYQDQHTAAARLRPTVAVLAQPGPVGVSTATTATAGARWRLPNGTERTGALTTVTAPAIYYAPAGTSVRIWLNRSGEPVAPPPSADDLILTTLCVGFTATASVAVVLMLCYYLCRMALDRHRLARWESAWAAVGPQWTSHR